MDAAQKLLKLSAILLASALLMATPGWADTALPVLQAPATVSIGASGSSSVYVTSSGSPIAYTVSLDYSVDSTHAPTGWLNQPADGTTPQYLYFQIRTASGLVNGSSVKATLTPTSPTGLAPISITVSYNGAGNGNPGGGSTTLVATPNPVTLSAQAGGYQNSAQVSISTTGGGTTSIASLGTSVGSSTPYNWLTASIVTQTVSPTSPGAISITANSSGLTTGFTYQGTVTVNPTTGGPLSIAVNFTVGAGGSGNWTVNPGSVTWNYSTGGGFPSQFVNVSVPSGSNYYNVTATSANNWLLAQFNGSQGVSINGITAGSGFTLLAGSQANTLPSGQYLGQATLSDAYSNQYTINVTLNVNGGTASGITMNPNPAAFNVAVGSAQVSQLVTVTSSQGGTVSISPSSGAPSWLTFSSPSTSSVTAGGSFTFYVYVNPAGLTATSTSGTVVVNVGGQAGYLSVNLVVGGGSTGTANASVAPASLAFTYESGTNNAFIARQKLVITGSPGSWSSTISSTPSGWLLLSPTNGTSLPDPSVDGQIPVVTINPAGLGVGYYSGTITITTANGSQYVLVTLTVTSSAIILPTPGSLVFTAQTGQVKPISQSLYFSGSDSSLNPLSITAVSNNPWISIVTGATYVAVQVDQTGLGTGVYSGSIAVSQSGAANSPTTIPVVLVVNGGGGVIGYTNLTFSSASLTFSSTNGSAPGSSTLSVSANSSTSFSASIGYTNGSGWLTVSPLYGTTPTNLSVSANAAGLASGTYNATISFNSNGVVQTVPVSLVVNGGTSSGNVTVTPTTLTFSAQQGNSPGAQSISVSSASGAAGVSFTTSVTSGSSWLSTSANASNTTPATLTVSVNSSTLAAGSYSGNIQIAPTGGTAVQIPVTLTVTAPPAVSASPTVLTFTYRAGDTAPAAQVLTVSGAGASLAFTATASSTGNWLVASPASGTTPGSVNVSVNPTGLSAGSYNGTVAVAGAGGATGSTTVNVTLTVTAPLPTITKVTNAASYAQGSVSPGEIITLFASDSTHPIGPANAAGLTLDATGKVSTTIGGVQVLINGYACPMIYASASQVSAVVPYEIKLFTSANVLVKFLGQSSNGVSVNVATTVPALFTANSSGTGPGAIVNSNGSTNTPSNPAARGDVVVLYLTGEGETSPFGVTGKVTTVAAPPQPLTPGPLLTPSVTIGGVPANWAFAGEAPGFVSGVLQMNVTVPTNIPAGDQPIVVSIGGNQSQSGVTVSVK